MLSGLRLEDMPLVPSGTAGAAMNVWILDCCSGLGIANAVAPRTTS